MKTKTWALISCLGALSLMGSLTGCAGDRRNQISDLRIEDHRTAERVREALAAGPDYKYDGITVIARDGVVHLNGIVNTSAQRNRARDLASKVGGVTEVVNNLTVGE